MVTPEASYARAVSGSARSAVGHTLVGISFGYERLPDACFSTLVASCRIDSD